MSNWSKMQHGCWPDTAPVVRAKKSKKKPKPHRPGKRAQARINKIRTQKYIEQNGLCFWCKEPFVEGLGPLSCTADHVIELARGGAMEDPANIVAAHQRCNLERSAHLATLTAR